MDTSVFPEFVRSLPRVARDVEGLDARLEQGRDHQVLFMSFDREVRIPEHSHCAQWGIVVCGEIELSIDGAARVYRKGDHYFIPAGAPHAAVIAAGYADVTVFDAPDRYREMPAIPEQAFASR